MLQMQNVDKFVFPQKFFLPYCVMQNSTPVLSLNCDSFQGWGQIFGMSPWTGIGPEEGAYSTETTDWAGALQLDENLLNGSLPIFSLEEDTPLENAQEEQGTLNPTTAEQSGSESTGTILILDLVDADNESYQCHWNDCNMRVNATIRDVEVHAFAHLDADEAARNNAGGKRPKRTPNIRVECGWIVTDLVGKRVKCKKEVLRGSLGKHIGTHLGREHQPCPYQTKSECCGKLYFGRGSAYPHELDCPAYNKKERSLKKEKARSKINQAKKNQRHKCRE
ncbi:hypothetical protein P691DRAFT_761727 [Macrolepiota fuliginosa MF-IS2]|uniref:Uncharacterized protein n=1 Tax=Macrolepiota fuliginosa MF-IS2 TaxID=1400762 RepID=A0A9P5X7M4_9AGAR|nr:hypothetical protein P691DRAFT_765596 [Macrolepiota fuliginosa MF-IS2]KAF9446358.1 hypothetical protein P691DRAFT_761727 [Macrolepiota fuliginosa MF-IS2]